jgi:hypothetical protein
MTPHTDRADPSTGLRANAEWLVMNIGNVNKTFEFAHGPRRHAAFQPSAV